MNQRLPDSQLRLVATMLHVRTRTDDCYGSDSVLYDQCMNNTTLKYSAGGNDATLYELGYLG